MLKRRMVQPSLAVVMLEELVPEEHLLRKIDAVVDFSFIYKLCEPLYCLDNGRPAIDPEILFRMLFIGYLYGIRSEVQLCAEIQVNMAYRWFCGLDITDKVPDHATISVNRQRRFKGNNIAEQIFNEILCQAIEKGLVDGKLMYTDSTHVKAKANKHKKEAVEVAVTPKYYMEQLDAAIDRERKELGKKPFDHEAKDGTTKIIQQSTTDPQSGQLHKEGKPDGFHYSEHRTVDSKHNIVTNVHITPANINDVDPMPEILNQIEQRMGTLPEFMGMDAGYHTSQICKLMHDRRIQPVVGYRRHTYKGTHLGKHRFKYDKGNDVYICPNKHELIHKTTNREGYREYYSDGRTCKECTMRKQCFGESTTRRVVTRHVWQDYLDDATDFSRTAKGKLLYSWRKETIERSFADAKVLHGMRYARYLGLDGMREQSFLTAAVQNMKKMAKLRWKQAYLFLSSLYTTAISYVQTPYLKQIRGLSMV